MLRQDTDRVILSAKTMGRNRNNKEEDLLKYYESIYYVVYYSVGLPIETPRKKPLKVNHFQGTFFFRGAQSGDQSNNKILNGFKDIYWKLIQEHPELTARQVVDYYNPNALNPFALQQEDLLVWPVDKIIYGEWGRVKHEVRSPPQEVCKKGIHPSGCMASVSLPVRYELKDVSGIFQPSLISFA